MWSTERQNAKCKRQKTKMEKSRIFGINQESKSKARQVSARARIILAFCLLPFAFLAAACRQDMHDQPKYKPLRPADAVGSINDGMSARPLVQGTVARGMLREDTEFYTGRLAQGSQASPLTNAGAAQAGVTTSPANTNAGAQPQQSFQGFVTRIPVELNREAINRGEERFNIYCSLCHGRAGDGKGMIALRGFRRDQMPSFHQDRLRTAPPGYFFDVMTQGLGTMPSYAGSITAEDRWKIVAYIRALQLSQGGQLPGEQR